MFVIIVVIVIVISVHARDDVDVAQGGLVIGSRSLVSLTRMYLDRWDRTGWFQCVCTMSDCALTNLVRIRLGRADCFASCCSKIQDGL